MRVELPSPTPENTPPAAPVRPGAPATAPADVGAVLMAPSGLERIVRVLTSWALVLPMGLLCSTILTWSIGARLLDRHHLSAVHARSLKPIEVLEPPISAEQLAALQSGADRVAGSLLQDAREVAAVMAELEQQGRKLGWRAESTASGVKPHVGGFNGLTQHAMMVLLEDEGERPEPAYQRLVAWLRIVSALPKRVDVAGLHLRSVGAGLGGAQIELHLFTLDPHEENSPK